MKNKGKKTFFFLPSSALRRAFVAISDLRIIIKPIQTATIRSLITSILPNSTLSTIITRPNTGFTFRITTNKTTLLHIIITTSYFKESSILTISKAKGGSKSRIKTNSANFFRATF